MLSILPALSLLALLTCFGFSLYGAFTAPFAIRRIIYGLFSAWVIAFLYASAYYSPLNEKLLSPFRWVLVTAAVALAISFVFQKKKVQLAK